METFAEPREFVKHESYVRDREKVVSALDPGTIDPPILDIIEGFAGAPHCFTLQSCFGHFMWNGQSDPRSFQAVPESDVGSVRYNIAYLALCIEHSRAGARLRECLRGVCAVDKEYVQFASPGWFWEQYPNSYGLQVEPKRFRFQDRAVLPCNEARHVQTVRDQFFVRLREVVDAARREFDGR